MVSQVTAPQESVFRILYKMPGYVEQVMSYTAQDLMSLLKMLDRAEGISVSSTEKLIIHQTLPDHTVMEVLAHDVKAVPHSSGTNIIPFPQPVPRDVAIMEEVRNSLMKAREKLEENQEPEKKLVPLRGKVWAGFNIFAHEARSGDEYES